VSLNLYGNNIDDDDDGARYIADALIVNHSLEKLNLRDNKIVDDGAKQIADVLKVNHSLKTLVLIKNNIGTDGKKVLSKIMQELKDDHRYIDIR
jgi:Ran GTPase-activating protein (RanGAP) involved in mRNA processing and transport